MNELTQRGIAALKAGDREAARRWLSAAVQQNPSDVQAWMWLSGAVERDKERYDCLRQVLRLDPANQNAARGLAQILERSPHLRKPPQKSQPQTTAADGEVVYAPPVEMAVEADLLDRAVSVVAQQAGEHASLPISQASQAPRGPQPPQREKPVIHAIPPRRPKQQFTTQRTIFRARPSLVPVVLYFWLVILTLYGLMFLLGEYITIVFPAVAALAGVCFLMVIYLLARISSTRYELSNQQLVVPWQGRRVAVGLPAIFNVRTHQTAMQKLIGCGDVAIDAGVNGILNTLYMRNIPQAQQRAEQIRALVREQY